MNTIVTIKAAHAEESSITNSTCHGLEATQVTQKIPSQKLSKKHWRRLSPHLQKQDKESVEQALAFHVFHESLHDTSTPHWIERGNDGVYLLWGEDAEHIARLPSVCMDEFPVGTRIAG